ncbi:MAG: hypothetical protein K9M80_04420 [Candidatus Marinimicrobia bacterium]|nr:hypothetical protein [Candidatus Neomarinimicrobiota bacterium]
MFNIKNIVKFLVIALLVTGSIYSNWPHDDFKKRRNKMEKYRTWKMTKYLDLTTEQSQQFFPRLNRFEKKMEKKHKEIWHLVDKIDKKLKQEDFSPTEKDYRQYLENYMQIEEDKLELRKQFLKDIDDILNTEQKIKLLIFDDKFKHDIMKKLRDKHFDHDDEKERE